jgi:hypothetical protein
MINPKELRLGNWIAQRTASTQVSNVQVHSLEADKINGLSPEAFEPIILTDELLRQAGFTFNGAVYQLKRVQLEISVALNQKNFIIDDNQGGQIQLMICLDAMHSLQNFLFDLDEHERGQNQ